MPNMFTLIVEGGVKFIKCFKGGATYTILGTSVLVNYTNSYTTEKTDEPPVCQKHLNNIFLVPNIIRY
jgi:hypothetical protein